MDIKVLKVGPLKENCYVISIGNNCIVIDPGDEFNKIKESISNYNLKGILITHNHFDHVGALNDLIREKNAPVFSFKNLEEKEYFLDPFKFKVVFTPGHSVDSVVFYFEKEHIMFVGDFIFKNTIGRCDLDGGDIFMMYNSLKKIKEYDNCVIYPGHGESTTLDDEKRNNMYFIN